MFGYSQVDMFLVLLYIFITVFLIISATRKSSGMYVFCVFLGLGFIYYTATNYTLTEDLTWLVVLMGIEIMIFGFLRSK